MVVVQAIHLPAYPFGRYGVEGAMEVLKEILWLARVLYARNVMLAVDKASDEVMRGIYASLNEPYPAFDRVAVEFGTASIPKLSPFLDSLYLKALRNENRN